MDENLTITCKRCKKLFFTENKSHNRKFCDECRDFIQRYPWKFYGRKDSRTGEERKEYQKRRHEQLVNGSREAPKLASIAIPKQGYAFVFLTKFNDEKVWFSPSGPYIDSCAKAARIGELGTIPEYKIYKIVNYKLELLENWKKDTQSQFLITAI